MIQDAKALISKVVVGASVIALALGMNYLYAWTEPLQVPPNGNAYAPVNVSLADQIKDGRLGLGALTVYGDSLMTAAAGLGNLRVEGVTDTQGGLIIERRTSDPASPATGRMWLRTDL